MLGRELLCRWPLRRQGLLRALRRLLRGGVGRWHGLTAWSRLRRTVGWMLSGVLRGGCWWCEVRLSRPDRLVLRWMLGLRGRSRCVAPTWRLRL